MTDPRAPESSAGSDYLADAIRQLRKYKKLADAAVAQVDEAHLFRSVDTLSNSIAIVMKHLAGNMRSRWTGFLASDGEKPGRNRDLEFEREDADTPASIRDRWEEGWALTLETISRLTPPDLSRTIRIRGEAHTVLQAIQRQLTHYAYHVGQIVFLARHFAGEGWKSLSIPKGMSAQLDVARDGSVYKT